MALIDHNRLLQVLKYDPETGIFTWLEKISAKVVVGQVAGGLNAAGYLSTRIFGKFYYLHRLAWFYMTGEWPDRIDHVDGNRADNRISNLRVATQSQNILNSKLSKNNTSGFKGATWHKGAGRWAAQATVDGEHIHLGLFDLVEDAHAAYVRAITHVYPEFLREK